MNKLAVLIKFNRTDRHLEGQGWRYKKSIGRPEWWEQRNKILKDIVLPSLERQTFQDFDLITPFTTDVPYSFIKDTVSLLSKHKAIVWMDDRLLKDYVEPFPLLNQIYKDKVDNLILLNLDSDDIYMPTAFENLMKVPVKNGQVCIFRNGYVYDIPTDRLATYVGRPIAPPFFSTVYTKACLQSKEAWDSYRKRYNLEVEHPRLNNCFVKYEMPDNLYCYIFHKFNVNSHWDHKSHHEKIKRIITGKEKSDILNNIIKKHK